ncbi:MAG: sigma-54 dependent transcriptional regulator [Sandaracinus sp.]
MAENESLVSGARVTTGLPTGGSLAVELAGTEDDETLAQRVLAVALREIAERSARRPDPGPTGHPVIIGHSPPMLALFKMLDRIKNSDATVLILGENGTGKELVARSIHQSSRRGSKQFVATNCSAFNDNLLESEMFGHRRGAFTGAVTEKQGLFEVADGGTFFMDEVGDMSPALQVKLLRVLQEGTFMPVGGTEPKKVDVRIIAATNRDLATMVKQGSFREDLYYRLHVVSLRVPPLRERAGDVAVLVQYFLARLGKRDKREKLLTPRALERLAGHEWPGNVRELENEMERLWVLSGDERVIDEDLLSSAIGKRRIGTTESIRVSVPAVAPVAAPAPPAPASAMPSVAAPPVTAGATPPSGIDLTGKMPDVVEALERRMITDELKRARGNKTKAAQELGISRRNLIRKVQAYGLDEVGRRK